MKNISQVILLSTSCLIWYGADNVCASVNVFSGIPKSGTHNTLHTTPYLAYPHLPHLRGERSVRGGMSRTERSAMLTSCLPEESNRHIRVASVCFITDTGACSGEKFSNDETPGNGSGNPGGIPDYDTPQEQCQAAGYGVTSCPAGAHPENPCPADSAYYQKCVCDANMTQTCTKPNYGVGPSCDGKYASCKRDDDKACKEEGYTNTCPSGQKLKKSPRCPYDNSYGICCTESCPNNSSTTCTGANTGDDGCGYACYKCCDDTCPSGTSKTYKGTKAYTTGCGNTCYNCSCPSGTSPNFSGAVVGTAECGTCYKCSNSCPRGQTSVSCGSKYKRVQVSTTECGKSCYECQYNYDCDARGTSCSGSYKCNYNSCGICTSCSYNSDCDVPSKSCDYGCASTNSCGKCTSCASKPKPNYEFWCCDQSSYSGCNSGKPCWSGYSSCSSEISACQNAGGSASFQYCIYDLGEAYRHPAKFRCQ